MEFIVKIGADQAGLNQALAGIKNTFEKSHVFGGGLVDRFAGIVSTASIFAASRATIDWAGKLRDVSDALGVNVEWLQKMQNGARLAGGSIEDLGNFISNMNKSREDAIKNPSGANARAFSRMGISGGEISELSTQAFFEKIVQSFGDGSSVQALNDLQEVGGKAARNLAAAFASQFASDAPILSEALIDQLDNLGDKFTDLATKMKVDLAPGIVYVVEKIADFVNWVQKLGAFLGGSVGGFEPMQAVGKIVKQGGKGMGSISGAGNIISETFDKAMIAGGEAILRTEAEQNNLALEIAKGAEAKKGLRRNAESSAPLFGKPDATSGSGGRGQTRDSRAQGFSLDAMGQVGLFTGSSLAYNDQSAAVQKEQLNTLQAIRENTARIGEGDFK